jgi:hypothetical protein
MILAALEVDPKRRPSIALFAAALLLVRLGSAIVQTMDGFRRSVTWASARGHIGALTAPRPIKPTSPRCHSAWQFNPNRGSTYRCGKSVQTTGPSLSPPSKVFFDPMNDTRFDPSRVAP